jgi:hypothetical protein
MAREIVSWYTSDWVARERSCPQCQWHQLTVEISFDDLVKGWQPRTDHTILPAELLKLLQGLNPDELTLGKTLSFLRQLKRAARRYNSPE